MNELSLSLLIYNYGYGLGFRSLPLTRLKVQGYQDG